MKSNALCITITFLLLITIAASKKSTKENKPEWAKKDIRDYSEADLERLLDQWEVRKLISFSLFFRVEDEKLFVGR